MDNPTVFGEVLASLSSCDGEPTGERTWLFGERMATVYREYMARCDEDEQTRKWRHLYSAENMPPPSDTQSKADVAAMMAFYSPTNFCKMRKVAAQQLLDWCWQEPRINVYPFGMPTVTLIDIGAGVGIASLAIIELLAVWSDVLVRQGYRQAGLSVRVVAVEPDVNKQPARRELFSAMSSVLDGRSIRLDGLTEILLPYPEPECVQQIIDAAPGGSLAVCCMSNFLSSLTTDTYHHSFAGTPIPGDRAQLPANEQWDNAIEMSEPPILLENAIRCADASRHLLEVLPFRRKLLLAGELKERGSAVRLFARSLHPSLDLQVRWNRVKFQSPEGSYWHSRRICNGSNLDWATGFWSLAHWVTQGTRLV